MLGITHFSKNTKKNAPVERLTGSLAFGALARIVLVVSERESEEGSTEHVLCRAKSNIGLDSGGFKYTVQQSTLEKYPNIKASSIEWGEVLEGSAQDILSAAGESSEDSSVLQSAKDYLLEVLSDYELPVSMIYEGTLISNRTLQRAKKELGIQAKKVGSIWYWFIPEQVRQAISTSPTETVASLASLPEHTVDTDFQGTLPRVPKNKLEQLKNRKRSEIGATINEIIANGLQ